MHLLTKKGTDDSIDKMQKRLAIKVSYRTSEVTQLSIREVWSKQEASKACSLLCLYQMVDYCALLQGLYCSDVVRIPRRVEPGIKYLDVVGSS